MIASRHADPLAPATWRYGMPAIVLHWLLAALIAFMAGLGWYMMTIERLPNGPWYFDLHRSVGLVAAALVLLRILWRTLHEPAPLPASLPTWQVPLSSVAHWLLYASMVVLPVTGFVGSSYSRAGVKFFGLAVPAWSAPSRAIAHFFFSVHSATVWLLVGLVIVHAAGALKHLLMGRDMVFERMWFQR